MLSKVASDRVSGLPADMNRVVGIAVMRGWRCVFGEASHVDAFALIAASEAFHRKRSGQRYLEHEVVASALLQASDYSAIDVGPKWGSLPAGISGSRLLQDILGSARAEVTRGVGGGRTLSVGQLLEAWKSEYCVHAADCLAWPVVAVLAVALASGKWYGDVSVKHRRQLPEGPAPPHAGDVHQGRDAGQGRGEEPLRVPGVQDQGAWPLLHLDLQPEDQGEAVQMGPSWCLPSPTDLGRSWLTSYWVACIKYVVE